MGNKNKPKGSFGLTSDDTQGLRRIMREAATAEHVGEGKVLAAVNALKMRLKIDAVETLSAAFDVVHKDMTRADFGSLNNAIQDLVKKPREKTNKYAHLKGNEPA